MFEKPCFIYDKHSIFIAELLIYIPSERAFAYKMKLEAIKRQGSRSEVSARDAVAKDAGESPMQIQRFMRLTELIQVLLEMVDAKKLVLNPAVELSYLSNSSNNCQ